MFHRAIAALLLCTAFAQAETLHQAVNRYIHAADEAGAQPDKPWVITGNLGVTVTDGNSETVTISIGIDATKEWDKLALYLKHRSIYAEDQNVQSANEHIFTERLEYALSEISWLTQNLLLEHDDEEKLKYRIILTVGYKRRLVKKENFELFGEVGGGIDRQHAGRRLGVLGIDLAEPGVGYRAAHDDAEGLARQGDVVGVAAGADQQPLVLHASQTLSCAELAHGDHSLPSMEIERRARAQPCVPAIIGKRRGRPKPLSRENCCAAMEKSRAGPVRADKAGGVISIGLRFFAPPRRFTQGEASRQEVWSARPSLPPGLLEGLLPTPLG